MQSKLVDLLLEDTAFEAPDVLVKEQLEARLNDTVRALMMQGVHPRTLKLDWERFQERQREQAVRDVKRAILLERIADREQLSVSDEEVEEEIARVAQGATSHRGSQITLDKDGGAARIKATIRNRKSLDLGPSPCVRQAPPGLIVQP